MTRADPPAATPESPAAPPRPPEADWQGLWWIPLGVLVAALWGLFLIGLRQPGAG